MALRAINIQSSPKLTSVVINAKERKDYGVSLVCQYNSVQAILSSVSFVDVRATIETNIVFTEMISSKSKCVTRVFKIQSFINFLHSKKVCILLKTGIFLSIKNSLFKTFQHSLKEFIRSVSLVICLAV